MINQEPKILFKYFDQISKVPRPSKKEGKIIAFIENFANEHNLEYKKDKVGNIIIKKPATPGYEDRASIALQSHMDMVCEKNSDVEFDFEKDAIKTKIVDGWLMAEGTTLGADNGIGCAAQLAILASDDIKHGPLECLFTVDEETGLTGAMEIQPGFIDSGILLNLDSEDEGEMFVGCAGGMGTFGEFQYEAMEVGGEADNIKDGVTLRVDVKGLNGGHSGGDIHLGRGNANKVLGRYLFGLDDIIEEWHLNEIQGGNLHNAIPREAHAIFTISPSDREDVAEYTNQFAADIHNELKHVDPNVTVKIGTAKDETEFIDNDTKDYLLHALMACPHGVLGMSHDIEGLVETSTNLASIKQNKEEHTILIETSQRSSVDSRKREAGQIVNAVFSLAGAYTYERDGYPGWEPNLDSKILMVAVDSYKRLFGKEPAVKAIHAGLECGLFKEKYPHLDMISFGPTMREVHSPQERMDIKTAEMWWRHLVDILEHAPKK